MDMICSFDKTPEYYSKKHIFSRKNGLSEYWIYIKSKCPCIKNNEIYVSKISNIPNHISIVGEKYSYKERRLSITFEKKIVSNVILWDFKELPYLNVVFNSCILIDEIYIKNCDIGQIAFCYDHASNNYDPHSVIGCNMKIINSFVGKVVVAKETSKKIVCDKRIISKKGILERNILIR